MHESELLEHIARRSRDLAGRGPVIVGPGDDAAVLDLTRPTLATVDHLVGGRHFDSSATVDQIARKAVARSVSDIAAMGGTPSAALATGCLPFGYPFADELFDRMSCWARRWGCPLVGGDIAMADGPLVLTVTVLGAAHERRGPVLRSGAVPGDGVYVTGALGGSLSSGRHLIFEPRVGEGTWLCDTLGERLHAMIDLSDGLGRDGGRVARALSTRLRIDTSKLPVHSHSIGWCAAASDGEDYELLFTAAGDVPARCEATGLAITRIGSAEAGEGCVFILDDGTAVAAEEAGWEHSG